MLTRGDRVPHFDVTAHDGSRVRYGDIWQLKHLLLVALGRANQPEAGSYLAKILERLPELTAGDTACVATFDEVLNVESPAVLIADRWGEVVFVGQSNAGGGLPDVDELLEWLRYVQNQCPECQGEAR
jgi:hypothetical protein